MANVDRIRLIEAYYQGTLSGEEKVLFKQLRKEDKSFKTAVKEYKDIFNGFDALHVEYFQSNLENLEAKYSNNKVVSLNQSCTRSIRPWYSAAAAVVILVCATVGYYALTPTVFEQNFYASESIGVHIESIRGEGELSSIGQLKKDAYSAYQAKDYATSIKLLKDYLDKDSQAKTDMQAHIVLGVSLLAEDKAVEALPYLKLVSEHRTTSYYQEAEWMWILAKLKLEQEGEPKVQKLLQQISKLKNHIHFDDAQALLKQL